MKRLFVAIPLQKKFCQELSQYSNHQKAADKDLGKEFRWVNPQNYHITLNFLGMIDALNVSKIKKSLHTISLQTVKFSLVYKTIIFMPNHYAPNMIWVSFQSSKFFSTLANKIQQEISIYKNQSNFIQNRRYLPHITLARLKSDSFYPKKLLFPFTPTNISMQVSSMKLFESCFTDNGMKYKVLDTFSFF